MSERYISVTDDEYVYFLDTESEDYKTLEDFEKKEFETAKKDNMDIEEYEDAILQSASDKYWDYVYNYHVEADTVCDLLNEQDKTIKEFKKENNELRQDNDIKFWKLQCMHYFNSNSLFMSEISRAMKKGYKVSDKFQEYLDELEENTKKIKEKNKRLFGDSE